MSLEVYKLFSNEIHFWLQSTVSHCKIEKHVTCAHFWNIVSVCTYMESSYTDHQRSCAWIWNIWRVCAQIWKIVTPWPFCVVGIVSIRSLEKKREGVCTNLEHGTQMCTKTESAHRRCIMMVSEFYPFRCCCSYWRDDSDKRPCFDGLIPNRYNYYYHQPWSIHLTAMMKAPWDY